MYSKSVNTLTTPQCFDIKLVCNHVKCNCLASNTINQKGNSKEVSLLFRCYSIQIRSRLNVMPKRKSYTVRVKLELVTRMRNGEAQCKISREMGIPESTLRGWLKDEVKLIGFVHTLQDDDSLRRKKTRRSRDPTLDTAMLTWFVQERQAGLPTSGPIVKAQAEKLNKSINGDDSEFSASQGWLWRWQRRHGISLAKVVGDKRPADAEGDVPADADPDTGEDAETPPLPSPAEVVAALEIGLRWIESRDDSDHIKVLQMTDFLNTAKAHQLASRNQKKLTDFFKAQ